MSRRPVRRPRTARRLPGARRRETSRLTGKTVSRPEFPVSRLGFPVSRPSALPVGAPFMTPGARGGTRCRPHFARRHPHFFSVIPGDSVSHPCVTSGAHTFVGGHPCGWGGLPAALPVGAPFMTPGAVGAQGVGRNGARWHPHFLQHSGRTWRSSGRHKWRPYVFCACGCGLRRCCGRFRLRWLTAAS